MKKLTLLLLSILLLLAACGEEKADTETAVNPNLPQFEMLNAASTGIDFENKIVEKPEMSLGHYDYFYNGSGVAAGDFNNDGKVDLYFCGNQTGNKLYLNQGNWKFEDATAKAGVSSP